VDPQQQPRWQPSRRQLLWAGVIVAVLAVAVLIVLIGYRYDITLWDWSKLLAVPAVITGVGIWFNRQQREREQYIEGQRAQDATLRAYLDEIGQLLLDSEKPLRRSKEGDEVSTLARSLTLTALSQLDGKRKGILIQFLIEAGLIQGRPDMPGGDFGPALGSGHPGWARRRPIIGLTSADLRGIDLSDADLNYVLLGEANLSGANLRGADLNNAILFNTDLTNADLFDATVSWWGGLNSCKSLKGATMPNGQPFEVWRKDNKSLVDKTRHAAEYEG
jgi:hypothetical protein